ncbi:pyridoxamine 5'-phosphate oxidase family protein [Stenoxybacter acetivorans]|uniref:pyridoxamine 5'-phosphate oxidase family protein n=1 Tax=Stenoxybacter acetivorans TaxID=422441 RepID=UPI000A577E5E|nr:pyridoxamine 5'-phosphate oxidase family protein [Stenoxybacter acetivorans]
MSKQNFLRMMDTQTEIALATSVDNVPNVRVVNFYYDKQKHILFFATFANNPKVAEIDANARVAFTTIPHSGNEHIKAQGIARRSEKNIYDLQDHFINKIPEYKETIEHAGDFLIVFELIFTSAIVTLDLENSEILSFTAV